jgi:hypothetical protein
MPVIFGGVGNIPNTSLGDSANAPALQGKAGDLIASELHGKYYTSAYRGRLFSASAAAVTVPVIASGLVSVFALWNPPGSGVNMEIVETTVSQVLAATVVDTVGWYYSTVAATAAGTFTTFGTVQSQIVGNTPANAGRFLSAFTHSVTPTLIDIIGEFGATTNATTLPVTKLYDGRLILPPGIAMSVAMSTNAGTTAGLTVLASWAEFPI